MTTKPMADGTALKRLNFDVPEELAREFKAYAALQGKSQREIVIAFMHRCVNKMPQTTTTTLPKAPTTPGNEVTEPSD